MAVFAARIALFLIGLAFSAIISISPLKLGNVNFDINTLLYSAAATIIGFQLILFYVLIKKYAFSYEFHTYDQNRRFPLSVLR